MEDDFALHRMPPETGSFTAKSTQPGINPIGNGARSVMGSKS